MVLREPFRPPPHSTGSLRFLLPEIRPGTGHADVTPATREENGHEPVST